MRTSARTLLLALALALALTAAPAATAVADEAVPASGEFEAIIDFSTLTFEEAAEGSHCDLTVSGTLVFEGTLEGSAEGTTTAHVLAPCEDVLTAELGAYRDVFRFTGTFEGEVNGTPATGELTYFGVNHPDEGIEASVLLRGTSSATLRAEAEVGKGGMYEGVAQP